MLDPNAPAKEIVEKVINTENIHYEQLFELGIRIPDNMIHFIMRMWDKFRLTNFLCLYKFPDVEHIKLRNPVLPQVNEEIYKNISVLFEKLIDLENDRALLFKFVNVETPDVLIYILETGIGICDFTGVKMETHTDTNTPGVYCRIVTI